MPQFRRLGAIDIGSNTIKLLVGDTDGNVVIPILQESIQTRLGAGLLRDGRLSKKAIENTQVTVTQFQTIAKDKGAESLIGTATSAVRDAINGHWFIQQLAQETGIPLQVINGDHEASLIFRGINSHDGASHPQQIIIDVGGGSTEAIVSNNQSLQFQQSYDVGSVRLLEQASIHDPLDRQQQSNFETLLSHQYRPMIESIRCNTPTPDDFRLIAAGGGAVVASMLLRETPDFIPHAIESYPLDIDLLKALTNRLWTSSLTERKTWIGMPVERADIIPIGMAILTHLMAALEQRQLWVSTRGLRFGLLKQHYHSMIQASL